MTSKRWRGNKKGEPDTTPIPQIYTARMMRGPLSRVCLTTCRFVAVYYHNGNVVDISGEVAVKKQGNKARRACGKILP